MIPSLRLLLASLLLVITATVVLHAQAIDTIKPNPIGVPELREVWRLRGDGEQAYAGDGLAALGDITGDSITDFAVRTRGRWQVYAGGRDSIGSTPIFIRDSTIAGPRLVVGDFWGDGRKSLALFGYKQDSINSSILYLSILIYPISPTGSIADTPTVRMKLYDSLPSVAFYPEDIIASDLDGDGADEIIFVTGGVLLNRTTYRDIPEIWIYRGGATFGTDTPQVLLHDTSHFPANKFLRLLANDFDNDHRTDLLLAEQGSGGLHRLLFWFGNDSTSPWNWDRFDRAVILGTDSTPALGAALSVLDADGDGTPDFWLNGGVNGACFFGSRSGKNVRTRSFTYNDAERRLYHPGSFFTASLGTINDSAGRFDMPGIVDAQLLAFSGSPTGPDATYEARHTSQLGGMHQFVLPIGDATGDGWSDLLVSSPAWYSGLNIGIALLLAGGPYIPLDPTAGVEWIPVTGEHQRAIALWPQPTRDQLNIAWRGDLHRIPARFEVHTLNGQLVASGSVENPRSGELRWNCTGIPAGAYLLTLLDDHSRSIATASFIIQ